MGEMSESEFDLSNTGEKTYTYEHRSGEKAKVSIDGMENGGRVGVHHYSEDGSQLDYYRFRINNIDRRKLVAQGEEKDAVVPDPVVLALHSGGWQVANLKKSSLAPGEVDPVEVQLIDIRNGFETYANQLEYKALKEYYESMARSVEIMLAIGISSRMVDSDDVDKITRDVMEKNDVDAMTPKDQVEGWMINAVKPETQRSTKHHDEIIDAAEKAYETYQEGGDFEEVFVREMGEYFGEEVEL